MKQVGDELKERLLFDEFLEADTDEASHDEEQQESLGLNQDADAPNSPLLRRLSQTFNPVAWFNQFGVKTQRNLFASFLVLVFAAVFCVSFEFRKPYSPVLLMTGLLFANPSQWNDNNVCFFGIVS